MKRGQEQILNLKVRTITAADGYFLTFPISGSPGINKAKNLDSRVQPPLKVSGQRQKRRRSFVSLVMLISLDRPSHAYLEERERRMRWRRHVKSQDGN